MPAPNDEWVDHIDEHGNTIAIVTRLQMRQQRLAHRCVYLLVFNQRGELFIHQRTPTKDVYPGYWDVTVGGVPAAGEAFDDAARREGREELGVDLDPQPLFPFRYADERTTVQAMVYWACHDGPFVLQAEEVERGEFVSIAEALRRTHLQPFCPDGLQVLQAFQRTQSSAGDCPASL